MSLPFPPVSHHQPHQDRSEPGVGALQGLDESPVRSREKIQNNAGKGKSAFFTVCQQGLPQGGPRCPERKASLGTAPKRCWLQSTFLNEFPDDLLNP